MKSFKILVYIQGQFIKSIFGDFKSKNQAKTWTLHAYESIGVALNPDEIIVKDFQSV